MPVERDTPSTAGRLLIRGEPGVGTMDLMGGGFKVTLTGNQGVRFLSRLIEEATALRDEMRDLID